MLPTNFDISVQRLRDLIGLRVRYQDQDWQIIEVLEDGPSLVLQDCTTHTVIQPDQHGEAHRRVPNTLTIPLLAADKKELNPIFLDLDLVNQED